jgi:hypothetical protein
MENVVLIARDDGKKGDGTGLTHIQVHPDTVELEKDDYFTILNPGKHEIHTTSDKDWLKETTPTNGNIKLGPAHGDSDKEFKYTIHVKDIGELDPRVRMR